MASFPEWFCDCGGISPEVVIQSLEPRDIQNGQAKHQTDIGATTRASHFLSIEGIGYTAEDRTLKDSQAYQYISQFQNNKWLCLESIGSFSCSLSFNGQGAYRTGETDQQKYILLISHIHIVLHWF